MKTGKQRGRFLTQLEHGRFLTRLKNKAVIKPFIAGGYGVGAAMAVGTATTNGNSLLDYVKGGFKGIYTIPERIVNTFRGIETVSSSANDIHRDYQPARESLDQLLTSVDSLQIVNSWDNVQKLRQTGGNLLTTLQEKESLFETYARNLAHQWEGLAETAVDNLTQHPEMVLPVMAGFVAAGTAAGVGIGHYMKRRFGRRIGVTEDMTPQELAIYIGKETVQKVSMPFAYASMLYALGKDSLYTKFKSVKEQAVQSYEHLKTTATNYDQLIEGIKKRSRNMGENLLDSVSNGLQNYFGDNAVSNWLSKRQKVQQDISADYFNQLTDAARNLRDSLQRVNELEEKPFSDAYWDFMDRAKEGVGKSLGLAGDYIRDISSLKGQARLDHTTPIITQALSNISSNLATYPEASLLAALTVYGLAKTGPAALSFVGNTLHDRWYRRKEQT